ncbi:LLGL scribble cell polarity complex component 2 isoform X1 [Narcine bancroftii]|uniref:LLGL scribble cell polarity complex component 2 isoform X1 n=1 Tax=Narcine bancroftii TaxID=1343680 RepID=UPI003831F5EA
MKRFRRHGNELYRERIKQDLFQFNKTVEHGFPHQPSALAYSPVLQLMAIGSRSGAFKIYGAPEVEIMGLHKENAAVTQIHFLPEQGQLVTLLDDNSLHLWKLKKNSDGLSILREESHFDLRGQPGAPPSVTTITVVLPHSSDVLFLGTEGGCVFVVEQPLFREQEERAITHEAVLQNVPDEYRSRRSLGSVEALQENPRTPHQIVVGYSRGLVILWDLKANQATHHFLGDQQLESVAWQRDGRMIISSHSDGSFCQWPVSNDRLPQPLEKAVPYGPYPCKAIPKIIWLATKQRTPFILFKGGMPRASYGDRHCVSVLHGSKQIAFDFTSRVIDFFVVDEGGSESDCDDPSALLVLAEEELVAIDLKTPSWPVIQSPYLIPLHCSAITCSHHVSNIPIKLWERIIAAGTKQTTHYSSKPWPVDGGYSSAPEPLQRDLLLTGHEDGTIRFWDASGVCLKPLYKLSTVSVFVTDADHNDNLNQSTEDEWPPLRKVGCFDPYSDDPRLGIQKIHLCKYSGHLAVAGTAGQVLIMELNDEAVDQTVACTLVDILQDQDTFKWKGHGRLNPHEDLVQFAAGFQPFALVQCQPPAVVTSLALHSEWKLVTFGTSHGFGLYDYQQKRTVMVRCTLHPSDQLALEGPLSRVKSIKKSLRQSFRRIRGTRASARKRPVPGSNAAKIQEANARMDREALNEMELAPVQRRIEARSADDSFTGFVRSLYFADSFVRDGSYHEPSLWAGTNGGTVFAYSIHVPPVERRMEEAVTTAQAKEIQLMHRAPVVGIFILDGRGVLLPEPLEAAHDLSKSPDMHGNHMLLVISEEQFKLFTLPKVTTKTKLKLTAIEGSRVRKVSVANFSSRRAEDYSENGLLVLTNLGDIQVISLPTLKNQVRYECIRKEDVSGIASCVFTKSGQGFYLISPSEFERFSVSSKWVVEPRCVIDIEEGLGTRTSQQRIPQDGPVTQPNSREVVQSRQNYKLSRQTSVGSEGDETKAVEIMEHALLNDERVLLEIQSTLESESASTDRLSFGHLNRNSKNVAGVQPQDQRMINGD